MTVFTYSRVPAFNPNTTPVSVARSATGNVYDIGDTGFTTPLNLTLIATNTVTTTLVSDAFGMFPDFSLVDRTSVVFKSGTQKFVLTTTTPVPGPKGDKGADSTVPGPPTTDASLLSAGTVADARLPVRLGDTALAATYAGKWKPSTAYAAGAPVLSPSGHNVTARAAFTSGATFDPVNWNYPFGARFRNVVLALGTSITEGGHVGGDPNRWTAKLPAALAALLPGATTTLINAGVSGNTSAQMLARLPGLLDANPAAGVVVIETSVNDFKTTDGLTLAQSEANMRAMIAWCELAGARVIMLNSAPFTIATGFSWSKQIEGNKMAAQVATERRIPLVDLFNPLTDLAAYQTSDGLHPNASGHQVWADNIAKVLAALQSGLQAEPLLGNLVIDRFTRSDTANGLGTTATGHAWTAPLGTWGVTDGKAYESAATNQGFALVNSGLTNQVVSAVVAVQDGSGLVARSDATGANMYLFNVAAGAIYKKVAGVYTAIGPAAGAFANGDTVTMEVTGTTINIKKNGTLVATTTDTAITTGTYAGLWRSGSNNGRWDKFTVN